MGNIAIMTNEEDNPTVGECNVKSNPTKLGKTLSLMYLKVINKCRVSECVTLSESVYYLERERETHHMAAKIDLLATADAGRVGSTMTFSPLRENSVLRRPTVKHLS